MRVRCDKCGLKALVAASQCPHCGHLFELRDGFGDLLPLAHCTTCDTYYPLREGSCHWCGTKPEERARIAPYAWKGAGGIAFVGVVLAAWLSSRGSGELPVTLQSSTTAPLEARGMLVDPGVAAETLAQADTANTTSQYVATGVVGADTMAVDSASRDTTLPARVVIEPAPVAREPAPVRAPTIVAKRSVSSSKPAARSTRSVRWVGATVREWVTVRAAAAHSARFVASIGPDTRVQLGEARGEWRRVRMKGISGWVERSQF